MIEPKFIHPGNGENIYPRGMRLDPDYDLGWKPYSDFERNVASVDVVRVLEREWVENGLGLVASKVALQGTLGDLSNIRLTDHMASDHKSRQENPTPFVSFSTNPADLAEKIILRHGYGIQREQKGVIVQAAVHPERLISPGGGGQSEVLLVGGVAPDEFRGVQGVADFVRKHVDPDVQVKLVGGAGVMGRDEALEFWKDKKYRTSEGWF